MYANHMTPHDVKSMLLIPMVGSVTDHEPPHNGSVGLNPLVHPESDEIDTVGDVPIWEALKLPVKTSHVGRLDHWEAHIGQKVPEVLGYEMEFPRHGSQLVKPSKKSDADGLKMVLDGHGMT